MKSLILCLAVVLLCSSFAAADQAKTCDEEPESGFCQAYFPSYYYDQELIKIKVKINKESLRQDLIWNGIL
ncbi:hypothetical protein TNCT_135241 [Trichonephila clavata]|uniref:Uncharacterized protein n=1 Tax=Trichonephila clavata TaxID=2740835 RepID=A0A8X6F3Z1_TRICU|nr:hypothetical protein TNCT_135241 [Trichonephila clavata]